MTESVEEFALNPTRVKRLSRQERKAQTRALLISMGKKSFLRRGFAAATAEEISEDAGFTRGALHSNFEDKEGLFLEVIRECHQRLCSIFVKLVQNFSGQMLLQELREALADMLKDSDFRLIVEFELEALRNEKLRQGYIAFNKETVRDALNIMDGIINSSDVRFAMGPSDFIIAMMSFARGIAAKQMLLGSVDFSEAHSRDMIFAVFDRCVLPSVSGTAVRRKRLRKLRLSPSTA